MQNFFGNENQNNQSIQSIKSKALSIGENLLNSYGYGDDDILRNEIKILIYEMLFANGVLSYNDIPKDLLIQIQNTMKKQDNPEKCIQENDSKDPFKGNIDFRVLIKFISTSNIRLSIPIPVEITLGEALKEYLRFFNLNENSTIAFIFNSQLLNIGMTQKIGEFNFRNGNEIIVFDPNSELKFIMQETHQNNEKIKKEIVDRGLKRFKMAQKKRNKQVILSEQNKEMIDMCHLAEVSKKEILFHTMNNNNQFIHEDFAISKPDYFMLGILAKYLEKEGCTVAIEKNPIEENNPKKDDYMALTLQFIMNGFIGYKKYIIDFRRDNMTENNQSYIMDLSKILSNKLKIYDQNKIIVSFSPNIQDELLIIIKDIKYQNLDQNFFIEIFNNNSKIGKYNGFTVKPIIDGCILNMNMHAEEGDNADEEEDFGFGGWGENEKRGGRPYFPPKGWYGHGLTVLGRYENDDWIGYEGGKEWCVAYHGAFKKYDLQEQQLIEQIKNDEDSNHPGEKVGEGILCVFDPKYINEKAEEVEDLNGIKYKVAFMLRVHPEKLRVPKNKPYYCVINGSSDELRPYRVLTKKTRK